MPQDRTHQLPSAELVTAIHEQCERALRRLRVLARERDDVLLTYALDSVKRAAALSALPARQMPYGGPDDRKPVPLETPTDTADVVDGLAA